MTLPLYLQITVGVIVGVGSYFIGNINTAVALSKLKGKDIRKCGSGNPGTMNMIRTFGKPFGALTLLLDVAKGVLPSLLGWLFMGNGEEIIEQKRITVDSQQWSEFMQELVAPDGTKRVEIEITSAFDTPIYVDDISLIKVK